tara:strand:- start:252 stop:857 length:606 start_codon:yes stop_codon:yes gene_type:complete
MKKMMTVVTALTLMATSAFAENYDNSTMKLTAVSEDYSISVKTPETGANQFAFGTTVGPVDASVTYFQNGSVTDWQLKASKQLNFPIGGGVDIAPLLDTYVGAGLAYKWGDSLTQETITASPYVGVTKTFGRISPFAEAGFDWKADSNDALDFDRNDSYLEYGASFAMTDTMSVKASIVEDRSKSFDLEDKELALGLTVSF